MTDQEYMDRLIYDRNQVDGDLKRIEFQIDPNADMNTFATACFRLGLALGYAPEHLATYFDIEETSD